MITLPLIYFLANNLFADFNKEKYPKNWALISDQAPPYDRDTMEERRQYFSKALKGYINQGGDINEIDFKEAVFSRNIEIVKLLLVKQTNLKVASKIGSIAALEDAFNRKLRIKISPCLR
jgi:hypothetical protein